uniref:Uncharacterized protein n=1 Tax=Nelumbo nucifera TaxID=4432 RepID=A0A822XQC6_NELNU|nr:TPA_asm: hypothetical protein HUJ06_024000 [Nelumbo nucifera]
MLTADELLFEGRLFPFWEMQHLEKLNKISLKTKDAEGDHWTEEVFSQSEERRSSHALFNSSNREETIGQRRRKSLSM